MSNQIIKIDSYQPKSTEKFFFDANIWLFLFCPIGNYQANVVLEYDNLFQKIRKEEASLFISSLVLSEFFNAYMKLEFKLWKNRDPNNKEYREFKKTQTYRETASLASHAIKYGILHFSERVDDEFSGIDIEELFLQIENSDFNDNYYLEFVLMEKMIFVTNDGNLPSQKVKSPIITGNPRLLAQNLS
jgi:hypothetical protein